MSSSMISLGERALQMHKRDEKESVVRVEWVEMSVMGDL